MTVVVTPPFPFFLDRVGAALDAGFVYIGLPNQDAQANPVAIFWDAVKTIAAPNPVRTFAGYLNNNGSPGNIFTADDYSILITDKRGILVFSSPSTARTGLGDITLSAGEKLTMESGSTLQINDGAVVNVGTDTGLGVTVSVAPNARFVGNLIPLFNSSGQLGSSSQSWTATLQSLRVKSNILPLVAGDFQQLGSDDFAWAVATAKGIRTNDVRVFEVFAPVDASDYDRLGRLTARDTLLGCCHQTSNTPTAVLGADAFNVTSVVRTAIGDYTVTFLVPLSALSYLTLTSEESSGAARMSGAWLTPTTLRVRMFGAEDGPFNGAFSVAVHGAASLTGVAGLPSSPLL